MLYTQVLAWIYLFFIYIVYHKDTNASMFIPILYVQIVIDNILKKMAFPLSSLYPR